MATPNTGSDPTSKKAVTISDHTYKASTAKPRWRPQRTVAS